MKKLITAFMLSLIVSGTQLLVAQDVINLGVNDSIGHALKNYAGSASSITVVIPTGYTSPEGTKSTPSKVDLTTIPTVIKSITVQGDGSMPQLVLNQFYLPANMTSLKIRNLNIKGSTLSAYLVSNLSSQLTTIDSISVLNCTITGFRGLIRPQYNALATAGPVTNYRNIIFDNCLISNIMDYALITGGGSTSNVTTSNISFTNTTVYGMPKNIFGLSSYSPVPATVSISDCTFDNICVGTAANCYFLDLGSSNLSTIVTVSNIVVGKSSVAGTYGAYGIRGGTGFTYNANNCYYSTDWTPKGSAFVGFTAYAGPSTDLFMSPTIVSNIGNYNAIPYQAVTNGDYRFKDTAFPGKLNAGDPRWYKLGAGISDAFTSGKLSYAGKEIRLEEAGIISVFAITGKLVKTSGMTTKMSVSDLLPGLYIVKSGNLTGKISISN